MFAIKRTMRFLLTLPMSRALSLSYPLMPITKEIHLVVKLWLGWRQWPLFQQGTIFCFVHHFCVTYYCVGCKPFSIYQFNIHLITQRIPSCIRCSVHIALFLCACETWISIRIPFTHQWAWFIARMLGMSFPFIIHVAPICNLKYTSSNWLPIVAR